jgi:hypothetical protein
MRGRFEYPGAGIMRFEGRNVVAGVAGKKGFRLAVDFRARVYFKPGQKSIGEDSLLTRHPGHELSLKIASRFSSNFIACHKVVNGKPGALVNFHTS